MLEQLLAQLPDLSLLATSRERLRLAGEWVWELAGLEAATPHGPGRSTSPPALRLFVAHAERVDRSFRLTQETERTVTTICRLVDGLPLGIELAAAWLRVLPLDQVAQELVGGLDAPHLAPRTLPLRHHSLKKA